MKKINETEITNIQFNYYNRVDETTGELVPQVTITFDGNVPCKDRDTDSQVDRTTLSMSVAQLKAKLYAASDVVLGFRRAKMRSLTEEDIRDILTAAKKVTIVSSKYDANEEIDGHIATYWGIRHEFKLEFDNDITAALTKSPDQRKAEAKAALLAVLK